MTRSVQIPWGRTPVAAPAAMSLTGPTATRVWVSYVCLFTINIEHVTSFTIYNLYHLYLDWTLTQIKNMYMYLQGVDL